MGPEGCSDSADTPQRQRMEKAGGKDGRCQAWLNDDQRARVGARQKNAESIKPQPCDDGTQCRAQYREGHRLEPLGRQQFPASNALPAKVAEHLLSPG